MAAEDSMLQESRITYKSISTDPVPPGLREIAAEITTVVIIAQPVHLYSFIADYLQEQLMARDSNEPPSHRMIRSMVENELTYEAMLKRWGVTTALANYAATIIQAVYRGHRTRLAMAKKTQEADQVVKDKEKHSEMLSNAPDYFDEANKAAICIQRNFRQIAGKPRQEKPPGEPQQRRRPRRPGPPNPHQPSEVATAPAELIPAYESTAKEAAGGVVADAVQSSSSGVPQPVEVEQEANPSAPKQQSKTSVAAPHKQVSKQAVATPRKESKQAVAAPRKQEVKRSSTAPQRQVFKQGVATPRKKEAKQSVTKLQKQASKQEGVGGTLNNKEAKQSVTKLQKQASKQEGVGGTLNNEEAKQSVTKLQTQASRQEGVGGTLNNKEAKQSVTKLHGQVSEVRVATFGKENLLKQFSEKGVSTSDDEETMQPADTPGKDSTIPLSGVAESHAVVLPIVDSLLWYVVNYRPRDPVSDVKDPVEIMSSSASQQVAASRNDAAPDDKADARSAPKLESLFASSPNQDGVFTTPSAQSRHIFVHGRPSLEADMASAMFVGRYESISVTQPPSRAAVGVESEEFYQAQECLSFTENERAQLLLNRSSNSIQTKNESSTRAVSLQSEVDVTRSEIEVRMRAEGGHDRSGHSWPESEHLLPSVGDVDDAIGKATCDEISDYDHISDI